MLSKFKQPLKQIMLGFIIGSLSGLLGIGGGVFLVPVLTMLLGFSQHSAHATSLAVVLPTAISGCMIYGYYGDTNPIIATELVIGSVVGAWFGAAYMKRLPAEKLKTFFGFLLILVGIRMVVF